MSFLQSWHDWFPDMWGGFLISLQITAASVGIGIPLGLIFALGVLSRNAPARWICLFLVEIGRGAPALVLLQFVYFGLPSTGLTLSAFICATIALSWNTGAYTSEIIRAGLDSVSHGQHEAAYALGLTKADSLRFIIIPQGLRVAIPALLGFSIIMLQASSLCFTIALPELMSQAQLIGSIHFKYISVFSLAAIFYIAVCTPATLLVSWLESHLGRHENQPG